MVNGAELAMATSDAVGLGGAVAPEADDAAGLLGLGAARDAATEAGGPDPVCEPADAGAELEHPPAARARPSSPTPSLIRTP
jgi:hypothetical protein